MELSDLEMGMKYLSSQGYTLNVQEIAMLSANLNKLQAEEKFGKVYFWGKIFGKARDYYVAYGLRDQNVEFPSKQFYCATGEKFEFADLPILTDDDAAKISSFPQYAALSDLSSYAHFRPAENVGKLRAMAKDDVDRK